MLLLGNDGTVRLDLGDGLLCCAEITSYKLRVGRDKKETTTTGDHYRTYIAGLKDWSGEINFNIRLATVAEGLFTAAQLIPMILAGENEAPMQAQFYLQGYEEAEDCQPGMSIGPAWMGGVMLLDQITIDVTDAGDLVKGAANFTGTGPIECRSGDNLDENGAIISDGGNPFWTNDGETIVGPGGVPSIRVVDLPTIPSLDGADIFHVIDVTNTSDRKVTLDIIKAFIQAGMATAVQGAKADTALQSVPIATSMLLGGVKIGANINVTPDGTISVPLAGGTDLSYNSTTRELTSSTGADVTLPLVAPGSAGLAPATGGGTANFLRADGSWAVPPGGAGTDLGYDPLTGELTSSSGVGTTIELFGSVNRGLVPGSGGGTTNFLRADGTWALPPGGGSVTDLTYDASTRLLSSSTGADVTLPLVSSTDAGLAPGSGGGTTNFLRADGTWTVPPGGAGTDLAYDAATRLLSSSTGSDVNLPLVSTGNAGLAPSSGGGTTNFLRADGSWQIPPGNYSLPIASGATLGGVRIGANINIDGSGVISVASGASTDLSYTASTRLLQSSSGADVTLPLFTSTDAGLAPLSGGGTANFLRADGTWVAPPGGAGTDLAYNASTRLLSSSTGADVNLPLLTSTDPGLAPASGGGTANFLRADGSWAAPPGGGAGTDLTYDALTRLLSSSTGTDVSLPLVTSTEAGLAPASGGGTSSFLRADGTWATPPGGGTGLTRTSASCVINLANGATGTTSITLPKSCMIFSIGLDKAARVVLYSSAAAASADSGRGIGTPPTEGTGVIAQITLNGAATQQLDPTASAMNRESPATTSYTVRVTNNGATGDVTVTMNYLIMES